MKTCATDGSSLCETCRHKDELPGCRDEHILYGDDKVVECSNADVPLRPGIYKVTDVGTVVQKTEDGRIMMCTQDIVFPTLTEIRLRLMEFGLACLIYPPIHDELTISVTEDNVGLALQVISDLYREKIC